MKTKTEPYEIINHTADIGLKAAGKSREEVFVNLAKGLFFLIAGTSTITPKLKVNICLKEKDPEALLAGWLNELIFLFETKSMLFSDFKLDKIRDGNLTGVIFGEKIDPARHSLECELKACTYHLLKLEKTESGWKGQAIFDA